jgi:antitoxin VapB
MKRQIAKVFRSGRSQAVRIPKEYRFDCDEVFIERQGERIVLTPRPRSWKEYFANTPRLPADYPDTIPDSAPEEVEPL